MLERSTEFQIECRIKTRNSNAQGNCNNTSKDSATKKSILSTVLLTVAVYLNIRHDTNGVRGSQFLITKLLMHIITVNLSYLRLRKFSRKNDRNKIKKT